MGYNNNQKKTFMHILSRIELELKVPITVQDEVSFSNKYSLVVSINHSGTLDQGHYWAVVKDLNSGN